MTPSKFHFFLGGSDLEMKEIQKLLEEHHIPLESAGLSWNNARWDFYIPRIEELLEENEDLQVVGIELLGKTKKPENPRIIDIDHHNYERCKPASIEQVAKLLGLELTDWQKKVAVNDKAYIPGLLDEGFSLDEIENIRRKDRETQGLTKADFDKAHSFLKENPPKEDKLSGLLIWKLPEDAESFTPYTDAFFFEKLDECLNTRKDKGEKNTPKDCARELKKIKIIFYNDNKFHYSGYIPTKIIEKYKDELKEDKNGYSRAFFGGAHDSGYFGFTKDYVKEKDAEILAKEWKEIFREIKPDLEKIQNDEMYSYHVFLFPFRWQLWNKDENDRLKEKYNLKEFEKLLIRDKTSPWKRKPYKLIDGSTYNEYNYFFDFVREILYDLDKNLRTSTNLQNEELIRHYEFQPADINLGNKLFYNIQLKNNIYSLEIDSIILNMYSTGVGILSFHLRNKSHENSQDILRINKYGRRLYPPFLNLKDEGIKTGKENTPPGEWLPCVKNNELPEAIWLSRNNERIPGSLEDYSKYYCADNFKHGPFLLPEFIKVLFPEKFFLTHEKSGCLKADKENEKCLEKDTRYKVYLRPALNDDRMYVISWHGNNSQIQTLQKIRRINGKRRYAYTLNDFWHNYIFIDTWKTFNDRLKLPKYLDKHTYSRWIDEGTLYGMSRYSMVMLTGKSAPAFLIRHLQTMYYKMAELSLLQRATIVSFSDEVTHVSDLIHRDGEDMDKAIQKIEDLYKHYILFVNKIYFREVTPQEQGIEMYDMMQRIMRIPEQVKDLDNEIAELNAFAGMIADKEEKKEMRIHTILATLFLPAMLIAGILGMNIWKSPNEIPRYLIGGKSVPSFWFPFLFISMLIMYYVFRKPILKHIKNPFSSISIHPFLKVLLEFIIVALLSGIFSYLLSLIFN